MTKEEIKALRHSLANITNEELDSFLSACQEEKSLRKEKEIKKLLDNFFKAWEALEKEDKFIYYKDERLTTHDIDIY